MEEKNPFFNRHNLELVEVYSRMEMIPKDGIIEGIIIKSTTYENKYTLEVQGKVSVYKVPYIKSVLFDKEHGLSPSGRDLFLFLIYSMPEFKTYINLPFTRIHKDTGMSKNSYYKAIQELVDAAVIEKKKNTEYWVNPHYIYFGNRQTLYKKESPSNIVVKHKTYKNG